MSAQRLYQKPGLEGLDAHSDNSLLELTPIHGGRHENHRESTTTTTKVRSRHSLSQWFRAHSRVLAKPLPLVTVTCRRECRGMVVIAVPARNLRAYSADEVANLCKCQGPQNPAFVAYSTGALTMVSCSPSWVGTSHTDCTGKSCPYS